MNDRWMFVKFYPEKNDFWALDEDRTRILLMTGEMLWLLSCQDSDGELRSNFHI